MTRSRVLAALAVMTFAVVACEDDDQTQVGPVGRTAFGRYVAVGTSVSMGVASGYNAATAESQLRAWPSLLATQARANNFRLPLFRPGGCLSPNIAPLSLGINIAGRAQASPLQPDTICAGLQAGILLPTNNVAITGHKVNDALTQTPESAAVKLTDIPRRKIMPLVMLPKQTQITAMMAQNPTFVSIELGANDILSVASGIALQIPGGTITPDTTFTRAYNQVIDSVKKTKAKAVLIGLPEGIEWTTSMRTGTEIHNDSIAFSQGFYLTIGSDCKTTNAANHIFVPIRVFTFLGAARTAAGLGQPRPVMTCADGGTGVQDGVLTPAELTVANGAIAGFNATIQAAATANGYAYASMNAWFDRRADKPVFSVVQLLNSVQPYGKYVSLDGTHPSAAGQILIANSAIAAINAKYGYAIPSIPAP